MTPAQCREVAHELRQFDGDDVEREFFDTVAQALDTYGDNTEREAQPS